MSCTATDENKMLHQLIPLLQLDRMEGIGMRDTTINFVDADTPYTYMQHGYAT